MIPFILPLILMISKCFTEDTIIDLDDATLSTEDHNDNFSCIKVRDNSLKFKEICVYDDRYAGVEYPSLDQLSEPQQEKCDSRSFHLRTILGTQYYMNWLDGEPNKSWIEARNCCREMCMELISLETTGENEWLKRFMKEMKIDEVWTSGRFCDFKGCEFETSPDMWPRELKGWFWAGTVTKLAPFFDPITTDWAREPSEHSQPDGKSYNNTGRDESCLAMINKPYVIGIHWHDEECKLRKPFICEESDVLLRKLEEGGNLEDRS